jgi:16S rRNA processing protein RimM
MDIITDFPERLKNGVQVFIGKPHRPAVIEGSRTAGTGLLIKLEGIDSPNAVSAFRNQRVFVRASDRPALEAGRYYHHQLIGCDVVDESGQPLGRLVEILQTGANDVYVVQQADLRELLLPALETVILQVEADSRMIRVRVPQFLGDDSGR